MEDSDAKKTVQNFSILSGSNNWIVYLMQLPIRQYYQYYL